MKRSEEVEKAIQKVSNVRTGLMNFNELINENKEIIDSVKTVLNYISELEKRLEEKILFGRGSGKTSIIAEAVKTDIKNKKAIEYIKEKQKIQYKYSLSQIECEELLKILEEEEYLQGE